jgi:DNA polymerase III subunit gamma/tau
MLGSVDRSHTLALVQALSATDGAAVLAVVDKLRGLGLSAAATLDELALLLQHMAVEQLVPGALDAHDPDTADARQAAPLLPPDETQLLYSMALQGREELGLVSDEYAGLAMVLLRFLAFRPQGSATAPVSREARAAPLCAPAPPAVTLPLGPRASAVPSSLSGEVAVSAAVTLQRPAMRFAPAAPVASAVVAPSIPTVEQSSPPCAAGPTPSEVDFGERWDSCYRALCEQGKVAALVKELASQAGLRHIEHSSTGPQRWCLVVARDPLRSPVLAEKLAAALSALLGESVVVELEAGTPTDSPALREAAERQRRQEAAEASIHQDPVVLELLSTFKGAQIVPGSIRPV